MTRPRRLRRPLAKRRPGRPDQFIRFDFRPKSWRDAERMMEAARRRKDLLERGPA